MTCGDIRVLFGEIDDWLCLFRGGILSRQQLEAVSILPGLRSVRKSDIPVDRMERVSCMSCNDPFFALMRSLDSNKNSSSNHLAKQRFILLSLCQACLCRRFSSLSSTSLLEFNAQGRETPCKGVHLCLEFFSGLLPIRHGVDRALRIFNLHSNRSLQSFRATLKS